MNPYSRRIGLVLGSFTLVRLGVLRVFPRVLGAALLAATLPACTVIRVGPDGFPTYGHTLNNWGYSGGAFQGPGVPGRGYYEGANGLQVIGNVPNYSSVITGSNDAGIYVGYIFTLDPGTNTLTSAVAFAVVNNQFQYLPRGQDAFTQAFGINRRNEIFGRVSNLNRRVVPGVWPPVGTGWGQPTEMPLLPDALGGTVYDGNGRDRFVGSNVFADRRSWPVEYFRRGTDYFVTPMSISGEFDQGVAFANNRLGHSAGAVWKGNGPRRGAFWNELGVNIVDPFPGHDYSELFTVSDLDIYGGRSGKVGGPSVAMAFVDGDRYNLNTLVRNDPGLNLTSVKKMAGTGAFTGDATFNEKDQAYIAKPKPDRTPTAEETQGFVNRINGLGEAVLKIEEAGGAYYPEDPRNVREDLKIAAELVGKDSIAAANLIQSNINWIRALQKSRNPGSRRDGELLEKVADDASVLVDDIVAASYAN
jgi:hypothetical protein